MTKERVLLQRLLEGAIRGDFYISEEVGDEIEAILAQPEQSNEPVAWMNDSGGCFLSDGNKYSENWTALYTAPPKRARLSNEDIAILWGDPHSGSTQMIRKFVRAIEDHWREK